MDKQLLDLTNISVVKDVAWMDERPQCRHLIASWNAGRDVGSRCENYGQRLGQPSPGYCPMNGGLCAMEDPGWTFKPGWDAYARWCGEDHGHVTLDVWPGFKNGMLVAYQVTGDCMWPTYHDGDLVMARMGNAGFYDGAICVISRRMRGLPVKGRYLKRLERIGEGLYYITADNPTFEPVLVPAETVNIVAVVWNVDPELAKDELAVCHVFDGERRRIVPNIMAMGQAEAGTIYLLQRDLGSRAGGQRSWPVETAGGDARQPQYLISNL